MFANGSNDSVFWQHMLMIHPDSKLKEDEQGKQLVVKKRDLLDSKLYMKEFDFYGEQIRLLGLPERDRAIEQEIVKDKEI